jgi:hypothetical protein
MSRKAEGGREGGGPGRRRGRREARRVACPRAHAAMKGVRP